MTQLINGLLLNGSFFLYFVKATNICLSTGNHLHVIRQAAPGILWNTVPLTHFRFSIRNRMKGPLHTSNPSGMHPSLQHSLYCPEEEHDACGIGLIAQLDNQPSHALVSKALTMLERMEHRGARGFDPLVGDGAGILMNIPDTLFRNWASSIDIPLPPSGRYAVGVLAMSQSAEISDRQRKEVESCLSEWDFELLGFRDVPVDPTGVGKDALICSPAYQHLVVRYRQPADSDTLERKLYVLRSAIERSWSVYPPADRPFVVSFSSRTMIYKGQLGTDQLRAFYPDLTNETLRSSLALVHSRFSTNTFPSWSLAQPFRFIAHNGEINTIKANVIWMQAREAVLTSSFFSEKELELLHPICDPTASDSRNLDRAVELLMLSGRSLPQVMAMLMPMAWESDPSLTEEVQAFYEFHALLTEPWDGPASVCFTDGKMVGACLDRNGLRPSRYALTVDRMLVLASEAGVVSMQNEDITERGKLGPGQFLVADLTTGELFRDGEVKRQLAGKRPYKKWLEANKISWESLQPGTPSVLPDASRLHFRHLLFGITREELQTVLAPMAGQGKEPIGSMGADTPLAVLSEKPQHLANYFKQLFAQVSNPPIDPIREKAVMSLRTWIGPGKNLLEETESQAVHLPLESPVLSPAELDQLEHFEDPRFRTQRLSVCFSEQQSLAEAIDQLTSDAIAAVEQGVAILILTDELADESHIPIPMLLAMGAVHQTLIRCGKRPTVDLMAHSADILEVHHVATLISYGATAVIPYHAFDTLREWAENHIDFREKTAEALQMSYRRAVETGLRKIMSKMGISTIQSYHGAQIFEILGLCDEIVHIAFTGTTSRLGGLNLQGLEQEIRRRHRFACDHKTESILPSGGTYQWRVTGERHAWDPQTIHLLQKAARLNDRDLYQKYAERVNDATIQPLSIRHLFELRERDVPLPLDQVESVEDILKRFATGAMSFGSISHEAHSTLAVAMNRIGGKSNSGEGGEDPARFAPKDNGDWERSAIKQIASGRFGVTAHYLSEAKELQIKIAQGAKPGEGGQLPGHKVDEWIGRVRHSTPGVGLISPPPHHDIYSIEDLAQLIYDLHHINPEARVSVKLVSKAGVGTIAAGVAKGGADHILISGYDGGTGASPLSSIRHAGLPWEMGIAEAHQTLVLNRLRNRVVLQADGGMRTGRDLAIATLLGAEEWAIATAALVVEGCILMRKCHLNTCPVGIATQRPELRERFAGKVEDLIHFFTFLAEDLRDIMARLGYRTVEEMVGQGQHLIPAHHHLHDKAASLELEPIAGSFPLDGTKEGAYFEWSAFEKELLAASQPALVAGKQIRISRTICNTDRSAGARLAFEITKRTGSAGLPKGAISIDLEGVAGQSFGAFGVRGMHWKLCGEANDYLGKGLSGARISMFLPSSQKVEKSPLLAGNVALYGATSGELFLAGKAGERFAVRNSGATAVVEGIGDHGCEYMTGGRVVILGETGKNFAAGMSGGIAYLLDPFARIHERLGSDSVDIDPLEAADLEELNDLLRTHIEETGSILATRLLNQWSQHADQFVKVIPREYKHILRTRNQGDPSPQIRIG